MGDEAFAVVLQVRVDVERMGRRRQHQRPALGSMRQVCQGAPQLTSSGYAASSRDGISHRQRIGGEPTEGGLREPDVQALSPSMTERHKTARHYRYPVGVA